MYAERKASVHVLTIVASWIGCICVAISLWHFAGRIYVAGDHQSGWMLGVASPWSLVPALIITYRGASKLDGRKRAIGEGLVLSLSLTFLVAWAGFLLFTLM